MLTVNTIVRPLPTADSEYSVCGNSVLSKAKVVEVFPRKANGNNIKTPIMPDVNRFKTAAKPQPIKIGQDAMLFIFVFFLMVSNSLI